MNALPIVRHRTALNRTGLSRPVHLALEEGLITQETSVFDHGCGEGNDLQLLQSRGIRCDGWDPAYYPHNKRTSAERDVHLSGHRLLQR